MDGWGLQGGKNADRMEMGFLDWRWDVDLNGLLILPYCCELAASD
jgi:hypothetical protein